MEHFDGLPWYRRPHVLWLAVPFLVLAITYGATIVPLVNIVKALLCRDMYGEGTDPEVCNNKDVSAAVAMFQLYAQVISGSLSAITSPFLGAWSDRYGRLRMLAITSMGMLAKDAFVLGLFFAKGNLSVWWLLVAYSLDGMCGSFTAGMAISHAYASDCTEPDKRATAFGWFHGALFTGIALGPLMASWVVESTGQLIVIFYIAIAAHTLYLATLLIIPESLSKNRQADAREKHAEEKVRRRRAANKDFEARPPNVWGFIPVGGDGWSGLVGLTLAVTLNWIRFHNIFEPLKILWPTGPGTSFDLRKNLVILAAVDTISFGMAVGAMTVIIVYLGNAFNWQTPETTKFVSVVNMSRVVCLLIVLPTITRLVRGNSNNPRKHKQAGADSLDLALIRISVVFDTLGFTGYALAPTGGWMTLAGIVASIGGIGSPTLQSSLTKHVPPEKVGQLLGATGLLHALARVAAPIVFNLIYAKTVKIDMPATVFVVLAASFGCAFVISLFLKSGVYYDTKAKEHAEREDVRVQALSRDDMAEEEDALL